MNGDHPRSRGVYRRRPGPQLPAARIIPARAGFTRTAPSWTPTSADHPRSRGVYFVPVMMTVPPAGSSPLARGLRAVLQPERLAVGIIPARAGFTVPGRVCEPADEDHPRSRGVYPGFFTWAVTVPGSSPLARGLHIQGTPRVPQERDHPRSRGVYGHERRHTAHVRGSSPLARGLPDGRRPSSRPAGIIPARAGVTHRPWTCPRS